MTTATVGAAKITRIEETYGLFFEAKTFFADWRDEIVAEHMRWMVPDHYDPASGFLKLSIHSWLLEIGGRKILIDTCVGNHKSRKHRPFWDQLNTPYLERLAAAGVKPEDIDMVMCTHLHVDHVGWNTRLDNGRWVPTFPNAKYVWSKTDFDHFSAIDRDPEKGPAIGGAMRDSVFPIVEAGLCQMVDGRRRRSRSSSRSSPRPGIRPATSSSSSTSQGKARLLLRRHDPSRDPGLSPDLEQLRVPRSGRRPASRGAGCWKTAPDRARCWRRSISARRISATSTQGRRLHAAVCV